MKHVSLGPLSRKLLLSSPPGHLCHHLFDALPLGETAVLRQIYFYHPAMHIKPFEPGFSLQFLTGAAWLSYHFS